MCINLSKRRRLEITPDFSSDEEDLSHDFNPRVRALGMKNEGINFAEKNDMANALRCWQNSLQFVSDDSSVYEMMAQAYLSLENNFQAVKSAEIAVNLSPFWSEARLTLARAQREIGEIQLSEQSYKIALSIDPSNQEIVSELAEIGKILGSLENIWSSRVAKLEESECPDDEEVNRCFLNLSRRCPPSGKLT